MRHGFILALLFSSACSTSIRSRRSRIWGGPGGNGPPYLLAFIAGGDAEQEFTKAFLDAEAAGETEVTLWERSESVESLQYKVGEADFVEYVQRELVALKADFLFREIPGVNERVDACICAWNDEEGADGQFGDVCSFLEDGVADLPALYECEEFWFAMRDAKALSEKVAERVATIKPQNFMFVCHGFGPEWKDPFSMQRIYTEALQRSLTDTNVKANMILATCAAPPIEALAQWKACFNKDADETVVNFTPWGYIAKSALTGGYLNSCFDVPSQVNMQEWLLNVCTDGGLSPFRSKASQFVESFPATADGVINQLPILVESINRATKENVERGAYRKNKPAFTTFANTFLCAAAVNGGNRSLAFEAALEPFQASFPKYSVELLQELAHTLDSRKLSKKARRYKSFEPHYVSQLEAFLLPFRELMDIQPNDWARAWLQNARCVEMILKGIHAARVDCTESMNAKLFDKPFAIPGGPSVRTPLAVAPEVDEEVPHQGDSFAL